MSDHWSDFGGASIKPVHVLGISGSLRKASFSTGVLRAMSREEFPGVLIAVKTLEDIPLYNEDLDTDPAIPAVAKLRTVVLESDGVVIATPEYNHGVPGVLKNALDWASRPAFASCFRGKPVLIITSARAALEACERNTNCERRFCRCMRTSFRVARSCWQG